MAGVMSAGPSYVNGVSTGSIETPYSQAYRSIMIADLYILNHNTITVTFRRLWEWSCFITTRIA